MEMWSEERNRGSGSSAGGGKYGPGSQTAGLGQAPPRPSVVRGEKLWSLVKRWWREVWSRERNRGSGSSAGGGKCGLGSKTAARVQRWWREVWSREPNCGFGSSPASPECGPRREIMVFGQALVAGSVVQGAKLRPGSSQTPP